MIDKLEALVKEWEAEAAFLTNAHDLPGDRSVGKAYKECATALKEAMNQPHNPSLKADKREFCQCESGPLFYSALATKCLRCGKPLAP